MGDSTAAIETGQSQGTILELMFSLLAEQSKEGQISGCLALSKASLLCHKALPKG